jgi:hypothetical protein
MSTLPDPESSILADLVSILELAQAMRREEAEAQAAIDSFFAACAHRAGKVSEKINRPAGMSLEAPSKES